MSYFGHLCLTAIRLLRKLPFPTDRQTKMAKSEKSPSIATITQQFITERPAIRECLQKGVINYSSLAREICRTSKVDNFEAVVVAARRYASRLTRLAIKGSKAYALIKAARIRVRTRMCVMIVEKGKDFDRVHQLRKMVKENRGDFNLVEGEDCLTVIVNDEFMPTMREIFKGRIIKTASGLSQITMIFDRAIENTPGVVARVYTMLAERGINILEELSCWTDLLLVLDEKDTSRALSILQEGTQDDQ